MKYVGESTLQSLINKIKTALSGKANTSDLSTVATSGSYNDLSDKPTIPSAYTLPVAGNRVLGGVVSGGGISVDENGNVFINDDSHNHTISNVDGLQSALDGKASSNHDHDSRYYTESEVDTLLSGKSNTHDHPYIPTSQKGAANGVASLDSNGTVPSSQLPSYVDDIIEGYLSASKFYQTKSGSTYYTQITGETGKIYVDLDTNKTYRWSGSAYVLISESLAIGTTSSTAAAGNHTHSYAGSSSSGGAALSAVRLNTDAGSATQPVYFSNGLPVATTYTLGKSVPSDAKFTDHEYSEATQSSAGLMSASDKTKLDNIDGTTSMNIATANVLGGVLSGPDVIVDASGNMHVIDDSHNHVISNIDGLQNALDGKAASSHAHADYASVGHSHAISGITNLQAALDSKAGSTHTHSGYASTSHTHVITDITSLTSTLNGKSDISHTHDIIDISNLQTTLDGKASSSHTHAISDVSGLQIALDGKSSSSHTHSQYLTSHQDISGKVNTSDYNPDAKTATMTQAVGKDSSGKLWTIPSATVYVQDTEPENALDGSIWIDTDDDETALYLRNLITRSELEAAIGDAIGGNY